MVINKQYVLTEKEENELVIRTIAKLTGSMKVTMVGITPVSIPIDATECTPNRLITNMNNCITKSNTIGNSEKFKIADWIIASALDAPILLLTTANQINNTITLRMLLLLFFHVLNPPSKYLSSRLIANDQKK